MMENPNVKNMYLQLTVGDHIQNGFVPLAIWYVETDAKAEEIINLINSMIEDEAEPDHKTDDYTFCIDWYAKNHDQVTESKNLTMQLLMRIAPDQVTKWLDEKPYPDGVTEHPPVLKGLPLEPDYTFAEAG